MLTRRALLLVVVLFFGTFVVTPVAHADPATCAQYGPTGICLIWAGGGDPGDGGGGDDGGGGGGGGDDSGGGSTSQFITLNGVLCLPSGRSVPQPPQSEPVWGGHTDGAIYDCVVLPRIGPGSFQAGWTIPFWAAAAPPPPPDPAVLAREAVAAMNLRAVDIGIVPEDAPGSIGVIGLPTWMWVDNPGQATMGPITRTAAARGFTVTATAKVGKIVWSMGDGSSVTCTGSGTPYADSYGRQSSPTCGHTYTRDGRYAVTATSYWTVEWAGIGQAGEIGLDFSDTTNITMGEVQVIGQ